MRFHQDWDLATGGIFVAEKECSPCMYTVSPLYSSHVQLEGQICGCLLSVTQYWVLPNERVWQRGNWSLHLTQEPASHVTCFSLCHLWLQGWCLLWFPDRRSTPYTAPARALSCPFFLIFALEFTSCSSAERNQFSCHFCHQFFC